MCQFIWFSIRVTIICYSFGIIDSFTDSLGHIASSPGPLPAFQCCTPKSHKLGVGRPGNEAKATNVPPEHPCLHMAI